jgi:hypothetical protein
MLKRQPKLLNKVGTTPSSIGKTLKNEVTWGTLNNVEKTTKVIKQQWDNTK